LALDDDEIHLAPIGVTKITQFQIAPVRVLLVVNPLEQVRGDEVLESLRIARYERPVEMVVLLLLLDGPDPGCAEGREAEESVQAFENADPVGHGLVADLQILPQSIDREWRADKLRQPKNEQLDGAEIVNALESDDLLANQEVSVFPGPAAGSPRLRIRSRCLASSQLR